MFNCLFAYSSSICIKGPIFYSWKWKKATLVHRGGMLILWRVDHCNSKHLPLVLVWHEHESHPSAIWLTDVSLNVSLSACHRKRTAHLFSSKPSTEHLLTWNRGWAALHKRVGGDRGCAQLFLLMPMVGTRASTSHAHTGVLALSDSVQRRDHPQVTAP